MKPIYKLKLLRVVKLLAFILVGCIDPQANGQIADNQHQREAHFVSSGQWANYGNDPGGMRFSPLSQINQENVTQLVPVWTYQTGQLERYEETGVIEKAAFEATPIMLDGKLYFDTPTNRVIALDAVSGTELWVYDPKVDLNGDYSEVTSRGVSKWIDPSSQPGEPGYLRIIAATIDGRLIALDAETGTPIQSFGSGGTIDLKSGVGRIQVTSAPAVVNNLIITGSTMGDNQRFDYPPGVVRAYTAKTGELKWSWDPIPREPSREGFDSWQGPKAQQTGAANAWAPLSADPARDLIFVPTSSPSPDYYGGERKGDNLYANSLVAIQASTGKVVWHFQAVHHDVWDYDLPAQPILIDLQKEGRSVPAVLIVTKMGHIFVFNRETGEPLFPIEERPVPGSDIPGEAVSETQPFPILPPPMGVRQLTAEDAWGPTPELEEIAKKRINKSRHEGVFTPPSMQGSIITPSNVGGMNWSGGSFDPNRQILVTNVNRIAALITLFSRDSSNVTSVNRQFPRAEIGRQEGTPYLMTRDYLFTQTEEGELFMQTKPPWGTLAGIDMTSGQIKWEVPLGLMMDPSKYPEAKEWGSINLGGAITTSSGLTFIAASVDGFLRAFNTETGALLWEAALPAGGQATPMTYQIDDKQFVVIAAGGHAKLGTKLGDYIIAYGLK